MLQDKSQLEKIDKNEKFQNQININLNQNKVSMKDKTPLISIVIPLYNEENSIKNVLNRIPNHHRYEIIIVDDGSTDNSVNKVKEINNKNIKIIKHIKNRGYGAAILTGINHANGDIIITMDSDGQHNPEKIGHLITPIINNQADIVVGSRYLGTCKYKVPLHTRVGEIIINKCLWLLFGQKVGNNQSGFRALSKICKEIFENMIYSNFAFCTELLFLAAYKKFKITEVPITINKRKYGCSYIQLIGIIKAISICILFYSIKKFKIKRIIPKIISHKIYPIILQYLKNIF